MYGFGDDICPLPETLDLVEDIVVDYATTLLHKVGLCFAIVLLCAAEGGVVDYATALLHKARPPLRVFFTVQTAAGMHPVLLSCLGSTWQRHEAWDGKKAQRLN